MKKAILIFLPIAFIVLFGAFHETEPDQPPLTPENSITQDTTFDAEAAIAAIKAEIAGRENDPAEEVFENIQMFQGVPASRMLAIMQRAYNNSLGVSCDHCHNTDDWSSDEKQEKKITRQMSHMVKRINGELLPAIEGLKGEQPVVNCTTCHRGEVVPALNMN